MGGCPRAPTATAPAKRVLRPSAAWAETCLDAFRAQPSAGRALGPHALSGECPPVSACGRHLLLYFASKGMGTQRPTHRQASKKAWHPPAHRKPSPVAVGRPLAHMTPGRVAASSFILPRGLPTATGPSRSRPARWETPADPNGACTPGHPRSVVPTLRRRLQHEAPADGRRTKKNAPQCGAFFNTRYRDDQPW